MRRFFLFKREPVAPRTRVLNRKRGARSRPSDEARLLNAVAAIEAEIAAMRQPR